MRRELLRRAPIVLLLALLPMLTFVDHWATAEPHDTASPVPDSMTGPAWLHAHHHGHDHGSASGQSDTRQAEDEAHSHAGHCHLNSASCSDVPLTSIGGFALLEESMALIGAAALAFVVCARWWRPTRAGTVRPGLQPPRAAFVAAL